MYQIGHKIWNEHILTSDLGDIKLLMYYYLLPKRVEFISFPDQSEAFRGAIPPIASSVGRREEPEALRDSHLSLPQHNSAIVRGF